MSSIKEAFSVRQQLIDREHADGDRDRELAAAERAKEEEQRRELHHRHCEAARAIFGRMVLDKDFLAAKDIELWVVQNVIIFSIYGKMACRVACEKGAIGDLSYKIYDERGFGARLYPEREHELFQTIGTMLAQRWNERKQRSITPEITSLDRDVAATVQEMTKPLLNIADVPLSEHGHGEMFLAKLGRIGPAIGAKNFGCSLVVVPPGKRAFPFHAHHVNEEMFFILSGAGTLRHGAETYPVRAGDVISSPPGGVEVAHQLVNTGSEDLRYLAISTNHQPEVVEYPDSGTFAVASGVPPDGDYSKARVAFIGRKEESLDYWAGEGDAPGGSKGDES